jgi:hypothetical protein
MGITGRERKEYLLGAQMSYTIKPPKRGKIKEKQPRNFNIRITQVTPGII